MTEQKLMDGLIYRKSELSKLTGSCHLHHVLQAGAIGKGYCTYFIVFLEEHYISCFSSEWPRLLF